MRTFISKENLMAHVTDEKKRLFIWVEENFDLIALVVITLKAFSYFRHFYIVDVASVITVVPSWTPSVNPFRLHDCLDLAL